MKKLLFLFPIQEYMETLWRHRPEMFDLLNEIIDIRYRNKDYQIIYLTFKNKLIYGVKVYENDKVIEGDIAFEEHITPIGKDENGNIYTYTNNKHIEQLVGDFEELVVCGFHAQDCVMRVSEHFYSINSNTMVDEELTDFLSILSRRFYFNSEKYNLANKLIYDEAEDVLEYQKPFLTKFSHYVERYKKHFFHLEKFKPDFTLEECLQKLLEIEEKREYHK